MRPDYTKLEYSILKTQLHQTINELKILRKSMELDKKEEDKFYFCSKRYTHLYMEFRSQLDSITKDNPNKNPTQINREKRLLFLTRFDIPCKPKFLRSRDASQFYKDSHTVFKVLNSIIRETIKDKEFGNYLRAIFKISSFYCLARERFPELAEEDLSPFTVQIVNSKSPGRVKNKPFQNVDIPYYMTSVLTDPLDHYFPTKDQVWFSVQVYNLKRFDTFPMIRMSGDPLTLQTQCIHSIGMSDLVQLVSTKILLPLTQVMMGLGYGDIDVRNVIKLKTRYTKEILKIAQIMNPEVRCTPLEVIHIVEKDVQPCLNIVIMPVFICVPGTLIKLVDEFKNCKSIRDKKKSTIQYIMCQAVCSLVSSELSFALITDYNHFLTVKLKQISSDVGVQNEASFTVEASDLGKHFYELNCEIHEIQDGLHLLSVFLANAFQDAQPKLNGDSTRFLAPPGLY